MCRSIGCALVVLSAWMLISSSTVAQESSIDKLQTKARSESIRTIQKFMSQIWELDPKVQERLLRSRFTNATLTFHPDKVLKSDKSTGYFTERVLSTGEEHWLLSSTVHLHYTNEHCHSPKCHVALKLVVEVVPNSDMREWMGARDEYTEYSKAAIEDELLSLDLSGEIASFTWEKTPTDYFMGEAVYNPLTYVLTVKMSSFSTETFSYFTGNPYYERHKRITGSLTTHTNMLRKRIAQWVKFYMGKGKKPEHIR